MSCNVAFIGLGVMGYPMAGYISKGGHNVTVYNRTGAKADKWIKEFKGKKADTPKDAAKDADYVFTCVGNDNDLREVTFGENGIFKSIFFKLLNGLLVLSKLLISLDWIIFLGLIPIIDHSPFSLPSLSSQANPLSPNFFVRSCVISAGSIHFSRIIFFIFIFYYCYLAIFHKRHF